MKKFISIILSICCSICTYSTAFAYDQNNNFINSNTNNYTVIDEFFTDNYSIIGLVGDDNLYYITLQNDGNIEFVKTNSDSSIFSLWFSVEDIDYCKIDKFSTANTNLLKDISLVNNIIEYALSNITDENIVDNVSACDSNINPYSMEHLDIDEYNALMDQFETLHGTEHSSYKWHAQETYSGKTIVYLENLDYDMVYRDTATFSAGVSLTQLAAKIFKLTKIEVVLGTLADVIGVSSAATTVINRSGSVAAYFGSATYFRYVNVNSKGPYYEGYKISEYVGYVEPGRYNYARLQEKSTIYSGTTELIFGNYQRQRTIALENYS